MLHHNISLYRFRMRINSIHKGTKPHQLKLENRNLNLVFEYYQYFNMIITK